MSAPEVRRDNRWRVAPFPRQPATASLLFMLLLPSVFKGSLVQGGEWTPVEDCTNQWCAAGRTGPGRGPRSLIAIRPIFDDTANVCDVACMTNMIWGPAGSATVIEGASFGMVSFPEGHEGSAAIDVTLTGQNALESGTCDSYSWRYAAIAQAIVEHNLNAADFEHVVIFQPPSGACRNPGAAGGTWVHYFNGGASVVTHELGHAVGMGHATFHDRAERMANARSGEYQDWSSVMGRGGNSKFNLPNRLAMNWIPEADVLQIYDPDLVAVCGAGNTVAANLYNYEAQGPGPANSHKALVIRDCLDGFHWFVSVDSSQNVLLHRCNNPAADSEACRRTDLFEHVVPPPAAAVATTTTLLGTSDITERFDIMVGVADPSTGVVPVTVANCDCTVSTTTTTTTTVTTTTPFDPSALSNWDQGTCLKGTGVDDSATSTGTGTSEAISTYFLTESAATECSDEGMRAIASAQECERACYQLGPKHYRPGAWDYQPQGCFRMTKGRWAGHCHWNTHPDPVNRDLDDDTAFSRIVCTDNTAVDGSRQHGNPDLPAEDCGAWCKDPAQNAGAVGCEYVYVASGSLYNGCFAVYNKNLLGGNAVTTGSFCLRFPTTPTTKPPDDVCVDDDVKIADNADNIMSCEDVGQHCQTASAFGDSVRELCCATCKVYVPEPKCGDTSANVMCGAGNEFEAIEGYVDHACTDLNPNGVCQKSECCKTAPVCVVCVEQQVPECNPSCKNCVVTEATCEACSVATCTDLCSASSCNYFRGRRPL